MYCHALVKLTHMCWETLPPRFPCNPGPPATWRGMKLASCEPTADCLATMHMLA